MKEFKVEEHFNAANSFKPWKKNFLAECLKCESMSRPTDHLSSQLEVEHNKHLIWLSIMIVKWTLFIDLIMGIINIQSKKELVNALQLCFLHRRSVENLVILVIQETFENSDKTKTYQNVLKNGVFPFHFWTCFVLVRSFDTALCRKLSRIVWFTQKVSVNDSF